MTARPELHVITNEEDPDINSALALVSASSAPPTELVAVDRLRDGDSPRVGGESPEHVQLLEANLAQCPPILVNRRSMQVIDGMHRLRAARARGEQAIGVLFVDIDQKEAFLLAVKANVAHGLPLSLADREAAAARIVAWHPTWSDRVVARLTGLAPNTVAAIRRRSTAQDAQSNARTGLDGRTRPLTTTDARRKASAILGERPDTPLREVAREAGLSLGTAHDVRERLRQGKDPVPDGHRRGSKGVPRRRRRALRPVETVRWSTIRQQFVKDPVVRYADSGRAFVRWLDARATDREEWQDLVGDVPEYWVDAMINVASSCANEWQEFADELERRRTAEER